MTRYDAVLIPGGGLTADGRPHPSVQRRLDAALAVAGMPLLISLSGMTPHAPPPLDWLGFPILESQAGTTYLLERKVERTRLLNESCSRDTIGNAYFARVIHTDPRRLRRLLVITSEFHMPRTREIFETVFSLRGAGQGWFSRKYRLDFQATPNDGYRADELTARIARENESLARWRETCLRFRSLTDLHAWLHGEHAAYATGLTPERARGAAVATYGALPLPDDQAHPAGR
jgi:DUF218 domain